MTNSTQLGYHFFIMTTLGFDISVNHLRKLIGHKVRYHDAECEIIEILEDGPSIILQYSSNRQTVIQPDQYGEAHRRVPRTVTIPILTADKTELNPVFLHLDLADHLKI